MTIPPLPGADPAHLGALDEDLSFAPAPGKTSGGGLGSDPGLWLADEGPVFSSHNLLGSDASSPDSAAALSYYFGLSKPLSIGLPSQPSTSDGGASATPPVTVSDGYGSGLRSPQSGPPVFDLFSKGLSGSGRPKVGGGSGNTNWTQGNSYGLTFSINFDSSVGKAPAGFTTAFENAIDYFLNNFGSKSLSTSSPLTVTLDVGWGEVAGHKLSPFALGESSTYIQQVAYSDLYNNMHNEAYSSSGSTDQQTAVGSLTSTSPITGATYWLSTADAKALGLIANNSNLDGSVGFSSRVSWDFNTGTTPGSNQYDFTAVAAHEISEVMGRIALLGETVGGVSNSYSNLDLFRYSAPDVRSLTGGQTAYLSFDSGNTRLNYFNTSSGGDYGDWQSSGTNSAGNDAYDAFASSGTLYAASATDTRELNVLGYAIQNPSVTPTTSTYL